MVNASIAVNLVAKVVYLVRDPIWLKSVGDLVTLGVGGAATVDSQHSFGFSRSEVLAAQVSAPLLLAGGGWILVQGVSRFRDRWSFMGRKVRA